MTAGDQQSGEVTHRLDAMERNVEWLRKQDLEDPADDVFMRLGLIKGDVQRLIRVLSNDD